VCRGELKLRRGGRTIGRRNYSVRAGYGRILGVPLSVTLDHAVRATALTHEEAPDGRPMTTGKPIELKP
jgi:hypothetical protein